MHTKRYYWMVAVAALAACKVDGHFVNLDGGVTDTAVPGDRPVPPDGGPPMGWAVAFGSSGRDAFNDLALDASGALVAVGSFEGSVTFGGPSLISKGERDAMVVKLDATGRHVWSKAFGGTSTDGLAAVALDPAGNVYVLGSFVGSIDVDGATLTAVGPNDGFVAKLDGTTGSRVWAFRFGALGAAEFELEDAIAVSADGTKLATSGQFFGTANFGGTDITQAGGGDVFVAVYATADGAHLWSRGFGGTGLDEARGVAFDANGGVIIVGEYRGPASFGGAQPLSSNAGSADVFVARYAVSNGGFLWANGYGSFDADRANAVRVDAGAVFVAGSFAGGGAGISLGGAPLVSAGGTDGFVAKYDAATGSHIWSKPLGGTGEDRALDLAVTDEVWVTASFSGTTSIGNASYTSAGISDVAFGAFTLPTGNPGASGAFGGPNVDQGNAVAASLTALCIAGSFTASTTVYGNPLSGAGMTDAFIGCKAP